MVSSVPVHATGNGKLPPPILPTVVGSHKRERGPNTVLEVLKEKEYKTFGENVIFILNRAGMSTFQRNFLVSLGEPLLTDEVGC